MVIVITVIQCVEDVVIIIVFTNKFKQLKTKNYKLIEVIKTQNEQLQQLQNDIETIKKTELESIKGLLKTNAKVQAELLTENEKLKAENLYLKECQVKDLNEIEQLKAENEKLKEKIEIMCELYDNCINLSYKYKKCLEEIKEIASTKCPQISDEECDKNKRYGCEECYSKAILDKISEVIE